jgi:L-asparaginase
MKKRIYIANTGGTIGMRKTQDGYRPEPGYLTEQMKALPELESDLMPAYDIHEYDPLMDSANMSPENWLDIAKDIAAHYDQYDGFVVIHGTDTMAYTASALPFMLQGLARPVILTGGQIPLCEARNDSRGNLITAMLIAANFNIPEVCIFFGGKLLRGNRAVKIDAGGFDAFDSPNFPPLGIAGVTIKIYWDLMLELPGKMTAISVNVFNESRVGALRIFPGISEDVVRNILEPPIKGLVLETYGAGNAPENNPRLLKVLKAAADRGVVIVNCTQCLKGRVDMGVYATGTALGRTGVISGFDMTAEAALTKMFYLFSQNLPLNIIKENIQKNLKGELTPPDRFM